MIVAIQIGEMMGLKWDFDSLIALVNLHDTNGGGDLF